MSRALLAALLAQVNMARIAGGCEPQDADGIPEPRRPRPSGPPSRSREEARRRKQRARAGLPVVEPVVEPVVAEGQEGGV